MIRVSTIIPAHNSSATIARAVDSALAQNVEGHEIIVVNDGSTDSTARILEGYGRKITAITQPNRGRGPARNSGLAIARGDYIAFLDADDEWVAHNKLAVQIPLLDGDPKCVLVYSDAIGVDGEGRVLQNSIQPSPGYRHAPTLAQLRERAVWPAVLSSWVMRRPIIEICGGFAESFGRQWGGEDSFLFFQARQFGSFRYIPEILVRYKVSTIVEHLRKRLLETDASLPPAERWRRFFVAEDHFLELIREHYGQNDKTAMVRVLEGAKRRRLLPLALLAMHDGDRSIARRAYLSLLRQAPLQLRTHARLAWTFLPTRVSLLLSRLLSTKYQRALMGPPENGPWLL
jgi:glycosyltransferase involved in cell wall biosynthesis